VVADIDVAAAKLPRSRHETGGQCWWRLPVRLLRCHGTGKRRECRGRDARPLWKLDILHNTLGIDLEDGPVTEAPEQEFWRAIKLDLFGTFLCSKIAIPHIIKAGGGSVINMASNVALMALPGRDCYTAAKGGVASMTRSMAVEYAPHKIRVNAIAPSVTLTERVKRLLAGNANVSKLAASHLLGMGQPIHVANMAVYLASDEAEITTGQILSVDSGVTIS
jgi:NAD(P)-dependent dehydrogenase (short-subunit alcohol dehydrogenase family)